MQMDKLSQFKETLERELNFLTFNIIHNKRPVSIEYHRADFFSKIINEFVRLQDVPQEIINPEVTKKELTEVASNLKKITRQKRMRKRKVKLTEL